MRAIVAAVSVTKNAMKPLNETHVRRRRHRRRCPFRTDHARVNVYGGSFVRVSAAAAAVNKRSPRVDIVRGA